MLFINTCAFSLLCEQKKLNQYFVFLIKVFFNTYCISKLVLKESMYFCHDEPVYLVTLQTITRNVDVSSICTDFTVEAAFIDSISLFYISCRTFWGT